MMKVIIVTGDNKGEWELDKKEVIIGRGKPADINLSLDDKVSRGNHAKITYKNGKYWLEDMGSKRGTFIEGKRITEKTYLPVDVEFKVGNTLLVLRKEGTEDNDLPPDIIETPVSTLSELELTPKAFKSFVEANRIRANTLISNMEFSDKIVSKAQSELAEILGQVTDVTISLCGSFYRLEASQMSDADFFAVFKDKKLADKAIEAMLFTARWFEEQKIEVHLKGLQEKLQQDCKEGFGKGRFPTLFPVDEFISSLSKDDSDEWALGPFNGNDVLPRHIRPRAIASKVDLCNCLSQRRKGAKDAKER